MTKTNVMRILDAAGIVYQAGSYEVDENDLSGSHAADLMGVDHDAMYKTLVLKGEKKGYVVCCIPVSYTHLTCRCCPPGVPAYRTLRPPRPGYRPGSRAGPCRC